MIECSTLSDCELQQYTGEVGTFMPILDFFPAFPESVIGQLPSFDCLSLSRLKLSFEICLLYLKVKLFLSPRGLGKVFNKNGFQPVIMHLVLNVAMIQESHRQPL